MQNKILVASVHPPFGELLRLSLEERGGYSVRLVSSCEYAKYEIGRNKYDLVLLDANEKDPSVKTALSGIAHDNPGLLLIVFPPGNNPQHPLLQGMAFNAWLKKPFYLPDLLSAVEAVLAGRPWAPEVGTGSLPEYAWLNDDLALESQLSAFLRANCLAAVFTTCSGQAVARTSGMPAKVAEEISALVKRFWGADQTSDMARYIHRGSTGVQALLYVTRLDRPLLAALIFSGDTPAARAQIVATELKQIFQNRRRERALGVPEQLDVATPVSTEEMAAGAPGEDLEGLDARLFELLENAPSPDPYKIDGHHEGDWHLDQELALPDLNQFSLPREERLLKKSDEIKKTPRVSPPPKTAPRLVKPAAPPAPPARISKPIIVEGNLSEKRQIFTCVLIPHLMENRLAGDLADHLYSWAPLFCETQGWISVDLKIFPEALQWTVDAPAAASPGSLVRTIREQSSLDILMRFPTLIGGEAGGDFWAPGFLIVRGSDPPAAHMLKEFIRQTRLRQGLTPPE